jgi:hypothetical protein
MKQEELTKILDLHKLWLDNDPNGFRADLTSANLTSANLTSANLTSANLSYADLTNANLTYASLRNANLTYANLSYADLSYADLRNADLKGANLDFSAFPLWCGALNIKCDERLFAQLAYHMCRLQVPDELKQYQEALKPIAREFHRYEECGGL